MDRFVVREPRNDADFPPGPQILSFQQNTQANMINYSPEAVYYEGRYGGKFPGMQLGGNANGGGFMSIVHATPPYPQAGMNVAQQIGLGRGQQIVSGIDPAYLAAYGNINSSYIATGEHSMCDNKHSTASFGSGYQNRNFAGADRSNTSPFTLQVVANDSLQHEKPSTSRPPQRLERSNSMNSDRSNSAGKTEVIRPNPLQKSNAAVPKMEVEPVKNIVLSQTKSRADKIKDLQKSGVRTFSGPVEKVLKWHKALQDIGVFVIYEIVAKCVSVTSGQSSGKNLVIRDDNGPAMQVVYYQIDYLLPELKTPCTVRVVGRMMPGTSRLQAFNVRPATGDDVATMPRRAAVAAHHVAKLCNEFQC